MTMCSLASRTASMAASSEGAAEASAERTTNSPKTTFAMARLVDELCDTCARANGRKSAVYGANVCAVNVMETANLGGIARHGELQPLEHELHEMVVVLCAFEDTEEETIVAGEHDTQHVDERRHAYGALAEKHGHRVHGGRRVQVLARGGD